MLLLIYYIYPYRFIDHIYSIHIHTHIYIYIYIYIYVYIYYIYIYEYILIFAKILCRATAYICHVLTK